MCGRMHVPGETQFLRTFQACKIGELGLKESWNVAPTQQVPITRGKGRSTRRVDSSLAAHSSALLGSLGKEVGEHGLHLFAIALRTTWMRFLVLRALLTALATLSHF